MIAYKKIDGLIAAVFTPYHGNGAIHPGLVARYAGLLKSRGVAGVFVNGSSGEGVLLTTEERKVLAEAWMPHRSDTFRVIIHVGSTSVEVSRELAEHAGRIGADAIGCMAPSFFPSSDVDVVAEHCRLVAEAAPATPFYYYHLPVATGAHIKVNRLLKKGAPLIPNLVGVKYTFTDFMDMHQCISLDSGAFDVLHGHDEILLNGLVLGVKGAIGTTFNFMPEVYLNIIRAYGENDLPAARRYQMESVAVVEIMLKYVNAIVGGKAILKLSGLDCGPCRSPLRNLTGREMTSLERELTEAGYFELLSTAQALDS